jgi:hypothetical protein
MNPEVKTLMNSVAKEMDLNIGDVEKAYNAPFELQAIVMKYRANKDTQWFPSLRIPYFLIFYCPIWNKIRLLKKYKKKNETNRLG